MPATRVSAGLALSLLIAVPAAAAPLRLYYPDIEQGSATLVVSPTGRAALIDGGTGLNPTDDPVEDFIADLIAAGVVTSLDYVIATHYDEDHIGRLENVFQLVPLDPSAIAYDRGTFGGTPGTFAYSDYAFWAGQHNRTTITATTSLDLGGGVTVRCYVVNGELPDASSVDISGSGQFENSASVAVVVEYGDFSAWIGGDLTGNPEDGVADVESEVAPFVGDVDVYTFNHHGSHTSSNAAFLSTLKAEVGINQNSVTNGHGHPNLEVVERFLDTPPTAGGTPLFFQQNPGNPGDARSDDALASGIADCDDLTAVVGLPGTILVISDGASYQVSGCGFGALTLAVDEGGALGDFPPAIVRVARSPQVPLSTETVSVEADVLDGGAVTVELRWWLDGVEQTPIAMSAAGGDTYAGTLPALADGSKVAYRVEATDGAAQSARSFAQGYFSGVTPIATLRENDAAGVLVPKHYGVRVEGNLTVEPGVFHASVSQIYVQDSTGGVQVFDPDLLALSRGDLVRFVGEAEQFAGQTEVNIGEAFGNYGHTFVAAGSPPAPELVTVAEVGESLEGTLVRIDGVSVVAGAIPESGSGNLTISDDGGVTTLTLRIDDTTDIPGAATPTQPFDVIGVVGQFDSSPPLTSGYQLLPRSRADLLSAEVNLPALLIHEIHADPANGAPGDANGDGTRDAEDDEFVELVNTGFGPLDVSGWTVSDGGAVRHVFAPGTVVPAREAVVVFGGGSPTGEFGNAAANGLVFTASTGGLSLNNTGDTVTVADAFAQVVQQVTYGSAANDNQSLTRDPDLTNTPLVKHQTAQGAGNARWSPGARNGGAAFTVPAGAVILTEVLYDPTGADGGKEWVELYNTTAQAIDLSGLALGSGGADYTTSLVQLEGTIPAGGTFVVGGPTSSAENANPTFDQVFDFDPDFQNSGADADGVALFNLRAAFVTAATVPIDAVIYGGSNTNNLIDETGAAPAPHVGDAPGGSSIERIDLEGSWQIQASPDPGAFDPGGGGPPPPSGNPVLSEVFYDATSGDDGLEWVELYNPTEEAIDLSSFSLGNGGTSYASSLLQLAGTIPAGGTFVVGGPTSSSANYFASFDQEINFSPDFQNSGSVGDGVALFAVPASQVTSSTVPVDAVVYGPNNDSNLIDETGSANAPEVGDAPGGSSIERTDLAGSWQVQSSPNPGVTGL